LKFDLRRLAAQRSRVTSKFQAPNPEEIGTGIP